ADAQARATPGERDAHRPGEAEASLPEVVLEPVEGERDRPVDLGPAADERE
ncbi:MAG: hypothetical protein JOZ41_20250, partial [Chloroflexi bacterium]|nr:hypothetical protein [Chloroflexota bacterium]